MKVTTTVFCGINRVVLVNTMPRVTTVMLLPYQVASRFKKVFEVGGLACLP
jgi:hypothetical protein